jgi:nicotinamidase-related amidase
MPANKWMIDVNDAVLLLIDHQSGLFQLVRDMEYTTLRNNVTTLAKAAHIAKIPTITTASVPDGPNGPIIPDIHLGNPDALHVPRVGPINAWDHRPFVEAIEKTSAGRCSSPAR